MNQLIPKESKRRQKKRKIVSKFFHFRPPVAASLFVPLLPPPPPSPPAPPYLPPQTPSPSLPVEACCLLSRILFFGQRPQTAVVMRYKTMNSSAVYNPIVLALRHGFMALRGRDLVLRSVIGRICRALTPKFWVWSMAL